MPSVLLRVVASVASILAGIPVIYAQAAGLMFEWGFSGTQTVSSSLPSCRSLPIAVTPVTANGVPPFYMIAFAVGGTPITSLIGTNESALVWTVRHPIGTQLVLGVVDSRGNSAGLDKPVYTVTAGATTQCLPAATAEAPFKLTANVTDTLGTCEPWGLTIQGGIPPYTVTIAQINSPDVRNVTLGSNDDVYTYINRADPGSQLIGSVSDSDGRWASGSVLVNTNGSPNVECNGLTSSSSSRNPDVPTTKGTPTSPHQPISRVQIAIIAGASAVLVLLLFGVTIWALRRRRRDAHPVAAADAERVLDIAPFPVFGAHIDENDIRVPPPAINVVEVQRKTVPREGSRHTVSIIPSAETLLPPDGAPIATVTPPIVRELPPPYPYPDAYDHRFP
ncbi:hypothetical protein C8R43DRAFT_1239373 [Mycena crocata]|nr:hypothetical protein C8R43DRAFT_1239373 [Mycena crocata]